MTAAAEWINRRLPELVEEHGVVGAQLAVLVDGEIFDVAAGVLNNVSNEPVTTGSLFQIGSITKVWTATLVQELVNDGLLDLDRPVRDVLPDFRIADEQAAKTVTPRQLLCHTGGFVGDHFEEVGQGPEDTVVAYVEMLATDTQTSPPGELYDYSNAGYTVLGRIVEVLRGKPFTDVLRERVITPLGLEHVATHYAEYVGQKVADGHEPQDGLLKPVTERFREWDGPAGRVLAMNARDLLTFVRMHLGTTAFDVLREPQTKVPDFGFGITKWGLGWAVHDYAGGETGIGHTGSTVGYNSYLRVLPDKGIAIALLTNGGEPTPLAMAVFPHLLAELGGVRIAEYFTPPATPVPVDVERMTGVYRCGYTDVHVTPSEDGRVRVRWEARNRVAEAFVDVEREYTGLRDDTLVAVEAADGYHPVLVLSGDDQDRFRYLHFGRAAVRV